MILRFCFRSFPAVATAGLLAAGLGLLAGCDARPEHQFQGYIEGEYVSVAAPVAGTLTQLSVARGDAVTNTQPLFELEHGAEAAAATQADEEWNEARAQLEDLTKGRRPSEIASLQAQLDRAQANLKLSTAELARREQLTVSHVTSKEELDQARAQRDADQALVEQLTADLATARLGGREDAVNAAQAAVQAAQAARDRAHWSLDQKHQSSPVTGQVHDTLYRPGEFVPAGSPVVVLLPPTNLKVRFFVPQARLSAVPPGQKITVRPDGAPAPLTATVSYVSTQAEYTPPVIYSRETRADLVFMIEGTFVPADAAQLHPGQPVDVVLP